MKDPNKMNAWYSWKHSGTTTKYFKNPGLNLGMGDKLCEYKKLRKKGRRYSQQGKRN